MKQQARLLMSSQTFLLVKMNFQGQEPAHLVEQMPCHQYWAGVPAQHGNARALGQKLQYFGITPFSLILPEVK